MAHHQSAVKRIRTSEKGRVINRQKKSRLLTMIKAVRNAANKKDAEAALSRVLPYLDRMVAKNIIHKNKAANQKSKLTRFVSQMS
jgi:small subunit ribosomal protein S20